VSDGSKIEWTEATWNVITGCSMVSPACTNCYAMRLAGTRLQHHPSRAGLTRMTDRGPVWTGEVRFNEDWLTQPLKWKKPRKIFVCAHADLFHENVPDEWIDKIFAVMALCPQHTFQVLTKRPERMREYMLPTGDIPILGRLPLERVHFAAQSEEEPWESLQQYGNLYSLYCSVPWPLPNVWLGVTVENQEMADKRIPVLIDTPAAVRWVSAEPLLGPIDLCQQQDGLPVNAWLTWLDGLDWIVAGGESGPHARPMHPDWVRSIRDQCAATEVPFLFKQWGEFTSIYDRDEDDPDWKRCGEIQESNPGGQWLNLNGGQGFHGERVVRVDRVGKQAAGRILDGIDHNGYPEARS